MESQIEIVKYFLILGTLGFGGPLALLAQMQSELVERRKWVSSAEYNRVFALLKAMPGPLAFQMAVYLGFRKANRWGGFLAGLCLVLPAGILMVLLAHYYDVIRQLPGAASTLNGFRAGAMGLILLATWNLLKPSLKQMEFWGAMLISILLLKAVGLGEPLVIVLAAVFVIAVKQIKPNFTTRSVVWDLGFVCLKAGAVAFGTGLAIVPLLQHPLVDQFGLVTRSEFMDALAMGQLTPGPVIITVTFIGYRVAGLLGALVATVAIFLPGFIHMITWFPKVNDWLSTRKWIPMAVTGATAAVVSAIGIEVFKTTIDFSPKQIALTGLVLLASLLGWKTSWQLILVAGIAGAILL